MPFVPSFALLLQPLRAVFTAPTYNSLLVIVRGWLFAPRHTITDVILSAQAVGQKHYCSFHRVFCAAQWSLDELSLCVFSLVLAFLRAASGPSSGPVMLAVDDTLARKRGLRVYGAGMHHDPLLSSRGMAVMNYGHSWVVLGVLVRCSSLPCLCGRTFCLPVLFRLYRNHKSLGAEDPSAYRTRPELFVEMLTLLCTRFPKVRFHAVGDSAYCGHDILLALPNNANFTGRLPLDARLFGPCPERKPGTNGRPRKRGERLPSPQQMLQSSTVPLCVCVYGRRETSRIAQSVAYLYHLPDRPICVVAVHPDSTKRPDQAFFSTCHQALPPQVLGWYASRWSIEQTFQEAKGHLGFEEPQSWSRPAVLRTAPFALLLYTLMVLWFVQAGHISYQPPSRPWYTNKTRAAFADMLRTLRQEAVTLQVLSLPLPKHTQDKTLHAFLAALSC